MSSSLSKGLELSSMEALLSSNGFKLSSNGLEDSSNGLELSSNGLVLSFVLLSLNGFLSSTYSRGAALFVSKGFVHSIVWTASNVSLLRSFPVLLFMAPCGFISHCVNRNPSTAQSDVVLLTMLHCNEGGFLQTSKSDPSCLLRPPDLPPFMFVGLFGTVRVCVLCTLAVVTSESVLFKSRLSFAVTCWATTGEGVSRSLRCCCCCCCCCSVTACSQSGPICWRAISKCDFISSTSLETGVEAEMKWYACIVGLRWVQIFVTG